MAEDPGKSKAKDPSISKVPEAIADLLASLEPWELEVLGRVTELARSKGLQAKEGDHVGVIIH